MKRSLITLSMLLAGTLGAFSVRQGNAQECPGLTSYMIDSNGQCVDLRNLQHNSNAAERNNQNAGQYFQRVASFPVYLNTDIDLETAAEIISVSEDGNTLVYTDSPAEVLGFVDIRNPSQPQPGGSIPLGGEPTSVAVTGNFALVAVNTSPSFMAPSGKLLVVNIPTQRIVRQMDLGGQPDAVAVSPDGRYAAIAIENERDEDLEDGRPPQAPGGFLSIVDLDGNPRNWQVRQVNLDGVADLFPNDPEPEFVDINRNNIAAVTLQENNHIVLVDLRRGDVIQDFSAGTVNLTQIDTLENGLIELNSSLAGIPREPDGAAWLGSNFIATADEGDLDGGSRGFTIFNTRRHVVFSSGNDLEEIVTRLGHYPEERSENKGNEPENVEYGRYGQNDLLFVASERSSVVFVYRVFPNRAPELVQVLPAGVGPEGLLAIPDRGLFVAASEGDSREDGFRSVVNIYQIANSAPSYPTVASGNRSDGTPIPWGALSDLAADPNDEDTVYTVYDSFYQKSRIFSMDVSRTPALISDEIVLTDSQGALAAVDASLVNNDDTVNLDLEGVSARPEGGFWVASEGAGTVGDPDRPVETLNLLLKVSATGAIQEVITLPHSVNDLQVRFGYEGVTSIGTGDNELVYVAFQREWAGDPENRVRIGRYDTNSQEWRFFYYPIEAPTSPNGGWVGLSSLTAINDNTFVVIERDNQAGPDARIKRIYGFSIAGLTPQAQGSSFPVVNKRLVRDLLPDLQVPGGLVLEKIEGLAVLSDGSALIVNDNDGVDDSNGETQLLRLTMDD